ncbi:MAG: hypothetical protein CM1200mP17_00690 [Woeseia sp.]|nr:MAG: hypothetical protein CM1200mP17_00690 [Woeseia sp.]
MVIDLLRVLTPVINSSFFYSESGQDWHHFSPLIKGMLDNYDHKIAYVSSGPNDPGLRLKDNKLTTYFIGSGVFRILFFQYLDTALCYSQ